MLLISTFRFRVITPPDKLGQAEFALEQARIIMMLNKSLIWMKLTAYKNLPLIAMILKFGTDDSFRK